MASVNQTRPHCVNQVGKTHSKPLAARHDRGTAWARHGNGMLCMNRPLDVRKKPPTSLNAMDPPHSSVGEVAEGIRRYKAREVRCEVARVLQQTLTNVGLHMTCTCLFTRMM